jgi:hypothetical protein
MRRILPILVILLALAPSLQAQRGNQNRNSSGSAAAAPTGNFQGTIRYRVAATGQMASMMAGAMPETMEIAFLGKKMLMRMKVPALGQEMIILTDNATGDVYRIDHTNRVIQKIKPDPENTRETVPQFERTSETVELAGYTCTRWNGTASSPMIGTLELTYWTTDRIKPFIDRTAARRSGSNLLNSGVEGYPLKFVTNIAALSTQITYTAESVVTTAPDAAQFELPSGYRVEEVDAASLQNGF